MKILAVLLLIGLTSALPLNQKPGNVVDEFFREFIDGMELVPETLQLSHAAESEGGVKSEIADKLREALNKVLNRIKEAIDDGRVVKEDILEKLKDVREKMRELKVELGEKGKELLEKIRERARDYIKRLLERLGLDDHETKRHIQSTFSDVNIKELLHKLREHVLKNIDPETIKQAIEKLFDQGSELVHQLLQVLKEKGRKKLLILLDTLLDDDDEQYSEFHGISDYWDKIKDYFKDLKIDLQEKYMKFGEWVKNVFDKGMEHSKDKMDNIKAIAIEFAKHVKSVSKEVAAEAKEFFQQHKEELGEVWDLLKEAFQRIKERDD